jgi:hypothetical protein
MVSFDAVGSFWIFIGLPCGRFHENFQPFFSHFYGMPVTEIPSFLLLGLRGKGQAPPWKNDHINRM